MSARDVGFYGKLPSHGDFLRRRVSDAFVGVWDGWLQECIAASRAALGAGWLDLYLTSPVWRFAANPGLVGRQPIVGLLVPSVDSVGRYFYLTLVAELPHETSIVAATTEFEPFFRSAERLIVEAIGAAAVDFAAFDRGVAALAGELEPVAGLPRVVLDPAAEAMLSAGREVAWQIPVGSPMRLASVFEQLAAQRLATLYAPLTLWWTEGSARVEPTCLVAKGLPRPDAFAALLDGDWARAAWQSVPAHVEAGSHASGPIAEDVPPLQYRSDGATDVGRVRKTNQDCWLERPEIGLWAVADGIGGHSEGDVASRMVCDALADLVPGAGFDETVAAARARLEAVNDHLVRVSERAQVDVFSGSTVVALMTRGARCAVLWAGDSRVYRTRDGRLEQLTRDHSLAAESDGQLGVPANVITRAIGGSARLELDELRDQVHPGDRFLLCSDGLTHLVPDTLIEGWMRHEDVHTAVRGLIAETLSNGAPDNVTVVIVEASA